MLRFLGKLNDQGDEKNVIFSMSKAFYKAPDIFVHIIYLFIY